MQASDERTEHHQRGVARHFNLALHPADAGPQGVKRRRHERDSADEVGETQRHERKGEDRVDAHAQHAFPGVAGDAGEPLGSLEVDGDAAKAGPLDQAAIQQPLLGELVQGIDDDAIHEPEVRGSFLELNLRNPIDQRVKELRCLLLEEAASVLLSPLGVDELKALRPKPEHFRQQFGRMLQIAVHAHDDVSAGDVEACRQGCLMPETTRQGQRADQGRVRIVQLSDHRP